MSSTTTNSLFELEQRYVMQTYSRLPITAVRAEGSYLWDTEGKRYLDFFTAISVCNLGHCHPKVVEAVEQQLESLDICSNLIYTEPAVRLAQRLSQSSLGGKVFLCNSGAEANECAIKIARKKSYLDNGERPNLAAEIIVSEGAFHGRTLGSLSATPQPDKQRPFEPLVPGFRVVERNSIESLKSAVNENTIAIMLEPVQGETGVNILEDGFLSTARELCDSVGAPLVFDEIQCGLGRTGSLWAYQRTSAVPDIITSAKSLGGGFPIGAVITKAGYSDILQLGDHGSTFAGAPVTAAAANAVFDLINDEQLMSSVNEMGEKLGGALQLLVDTGKATAVRGIGLIWALDIDNDARQVVTLGIEHGVLLNATSDKTLRFLPPLNVTEDQVDTVIDFLTRAL